MDSWKNLHRYSDSIFLSTFFFQSKIIFLKNEKLFFWKCYNFKNPKIPLGKFSIMGFQKNMFHFSKIIFFDRKKKVEKISESLYRCKIFRRIHFRHPYDNLSCVRCSNPVLKLKITIFAKIFTPLPFGHPRGNPSKSWGKNIFSPKIEKS